MYIVVTSSMNNYPGYPKPFAKNTTMQPCGSEPHDYKTHIKISCRKVSQAASTILILSIIPLCQRHLK
jgi:hypothetical protein